MWHGKVKFCGQQIVVDMKNTKRNIQILDKLKKLSERYNISILMDGNVLELYDAEFYPEQLYVEINDIKTYFYDTLDDEYEPYIFPDSKHKMKKFRYKVDKIGYIGQELYYKDILELDREYDDYSNVLWDDPYAF